MSTVQAPPAPRVDPTSTPPPDRGAAWSWSVAGPASLIGAVLGAVLAGGAAILLAVVGGLAYAVGSSGGGSFGSATGADEQAYLGALALETYEWYTDPALLEMGWEVCDRLAAGDELDDVSTDLLAHPAASADIAATAVTTLCRGESQLDPTGVV